MANDKLLVDTKFFDDAFKAKLIAAIENFDEHCNGLLINSENFQALSLLSERYKEQIKCVYIDPPYNTGNDDFIYKDSYRHSSWLSMMQQSAEKVSTTLCESAVFFCSIDDNEAVHNQLCLSSCFGVEGFVSDITVVNNLKGRQDRQHIATAHEHLLMFQMPEGETYGLPLSQDRTAQFDQSDDEGFSYELRDLRRRGGGDRREDRPNMYFPIYWSEQQKVAHLERHSSEDIEIYPKRSDGSDGRWRWGKDRVRDNLHILEAKIAPDGVRWNIDYRVYLDKSGERRQKPKSLWTGPKFSTDNAGKQLKSIIPYSQLNTVKPVGMIEDIVHHGMLEDDVIIDYFAGSGTTAHAVINLNRDDGENRKYILVEVGDYFDTLLKPRIAKVVYSEVWKEGKPTSRDTGISHCFKYVRLESYEDTLNNLRFDDSEAAKQRSATIKKNSALKEDYMLHYLLDVETRGSHSLLNVDAFADPTAYTLQVKQPGTDEYGERTVDLLETFNYLIGLRVNHIAAPQTFTADFERLPDPELPQDQHTKLVVKGRIRQDADGPWWFRKVEGWVPQDPNNPNNGQQEKVLIVWRKLTGEQEKDNLMLDEWFQRNRISPRDFEFDTIYVNGSNNLPNLKQDGDNWKVRLLEEEFMQRMWDVEGM